MAHNNIVILSGKPLISLSIAATHAHQDIHHHFIMPILFNRQCKIGKHSVVYAMQESRLSNTERFNTSQQKEGVL